MRTLIRQLLIAEPILIGAIPAERWYGARGMIDTPDRPFAVIRLGGVFPGLAIIKTARLEVWVHEDTGSYEVIDDVILNIRSVLDNRAHETRGIVELVSARWISDSTDLYDDGHRTNVRSTAYDIVGVNI